MTYAKFKKLNIDTIPIGWDQTNKAPAYFCTPKGAKIIGRAGADGIHYCIVRGLGDTIFAVSPMNLPGQYVHPIARNFEDLLRLLLSCLDLNIIEQSWAWDEDQLTAQIKNVRNSEYFDETPLKLIREKCGLEPMENPFRYLLNLQRSFDYGSIPFSDEYYETVDDAKWQPPQWKVTKDGGFFPERGEGGREIPLSKSFEWNGRTWHIPSAYLCKDQVIVLDFFAEIDPADFLPFKQKADSIMSGGQLTDEDEETLREMNPANIHFHPTLILNGAELPNKRGYGEAWYPESCLDAGTEENERAKYILEHYGFDLSRVWMIRRCSFLSETKISEITNLDVRMSGDAQTYSGIHFSSPCAGDSFLFTHPVYGTEHTLTVTEYEHQELDSKTVDNEEFSYPTHMTVMQYTITPDLPREEVGVRDCAHGDSPRRKKNASGADWDFSSSMVVVRSGDGPTAVMVGVPQFAKAHSACSALHFEKQDHVEWRMSFRVKTVEDAEIPLI